MRHFHPFSKIYKIGDKVKIRVIEANKNLRKIAFELVENDEIIEEEQSDEEFWDLVKK